MKPRFRNRRFTVRRARLGKDLLGDCDYAGRVIRIGASLKGLELLDTCIHEALHACFPDLGEDAVDQTSEDIAVWLWAEGWRKARPTE